MLFDFPLETLGEEMSSCIEKRSIEPDELPCQINMMSSTSAGEQLITCHLYLILFTQLIVVVVIVVLNSN